jgi:hypothetical protein
MGIKFVVINLPNMRQATKKESRRKYPVICKMNCAVHILFLLLLKAKTLLS